MDRVHRLPTEVADKIAAGEVVERPASVVKELVENSIDAGARHIVIDLLEAGSRLIRVTDDGEGMSAHDLQLAFERHATSKLITADDLFAVRTLGFRGEALPSIAAVARVRAVTAPAEAVAGVSVEVSAGNVSAVRDAAAAPGTTIAVEDLFFNVPVRRKFLRKQTTELGRITDFVQRLALAYPEIAFELSNNRRPIHVLPTVTDLRERIAAFFGRDLASSLLEISSDDGYLRIHGYLAGREHTRTNSRALHLYLNRRFVRDKVLTASVLTAYRGFLESNRFPVVFLFLELDPGEVDVNVHPAKLEVRLRNESRVFTSVQAALRTRLEQSPVGAAALADLGSTDDRRERIRQRIGEFFLRSEKERRQPQLWRESAPPLTHASPLAPPSMHAGNIEASSARVRMLPTRSVMQIHNSFLLEETDEGFALTDQHALHERILYEETLATLRARSLNAQRLLAPLMVEVDTTRVLAAAEHSDLLRRTGLEITQAGPGTLALHSVPQVLTRDDPARILSDMLDALIDQSDTSDDPLARLAAVIACRGAVKAGEPMSPQEMESLLTRREQYPHTSICPHGRPTTLFFSLSDLAERFSRT